MDSMFRDRLEAGTLLARLLEAYAKSSAVVLGMARGGVEVGYSVARELRLPLMALVIRKVGAPQNPELAIGAVSETGARWIDQELVTITGASESYIDREVEKQMAEAARRQHVYSQTGTRPIQVAGHPAIVVDDGLATGASAIVAVESARQLDASLVVLATPVASRQALQLLEPLVDQAVVLETPDPFLAVGMHYVHFAQVTDEEVLELLRQASRANAGHPADREDREGADEAR